MIWFEIRSFVFIAVPEKGGMATLAKVVTEFHKARQQSLASGTALQSPVELDASDPAVFSVFANLHDKSVLYFDGVSRKVQFPYPEGFEAFELAVNHAAPLVAAASGKK